MSWPGDVDQEVARIEASVSPITGRVLQGHERILAAARLGYRFAQIGGKLSTYPIGRRTSPCERPHDERDGGGLRRPT